MQQLFELIGSSAGQAALGQIGQRVGLSPAQTQAAMAALLPAVTGGMKKQAQANPAALEQTLGHTDTRRVADEPGHLASDDGVRHGKDVLGTLFGSKDVSRTVAQHASTQTGIGADKLKALLPIAAALAAGAAAKRGASAAPGQADAPRTGGGLMGMFDADGDGNPLDDILDKAGKAGLR